jgi:hypothetical protein
MVNYAIDILNILKNKYGLRVRLSGGVSAKIIGPVHQIFLTIDRKEIKFHFGNAEFENLIIDLAWDELKIDFKPSDMTDLKRMLKTMATDAPESDPKK